MRSNCPFYSNAVPHQQARCQGYDVRDGAFHGLSPVEAEVSQHHTMDQSAQQEVHMPYQHHTKAHLHQPLLLLQTATTHP